MKYSVVVIDSSDVGDYLRDIADGIRYDDLTKEEVGALIKLSIKQNFSVIIQKYKEEDLKWKVG